MNLSVLSIALSVLSGTVIAQTAGQPNSGTAGIEEIVVTAQRRTQNLQDVAAAVTAFTPEMLDKSGIDDVSELQARTPGLIFSTNGPFGQPYIRGVGSDIINPGTDAPIAMFVDGAYQPRPTAAMTEFFDTERVEVLKGPQGTLYGRNASGGAIIIATRDPENSLGADGDVIYGNYDRATFRGALNTPINDDLSFRIAALYTEHQGYTENLYDDTRLDSQRLWGLRAKLKYAPGEAFSLVLTAEYTKENDSRNLAEKVIDSPALPLPVRDFAPLLGYTAPTIPSDPYQIKADFPTYALVYQSRFNATLTWVLSGMEFKSITAFTRSSNVSILDLDATEINFAYDRETDASRAFTQNFQLSSTGPGALQWIAGVDYLHENGSQNFDARLPLLGPPTDILFGPDSPAAGFIWDSGITTKSISGFADGRLRLSPRFTLAAGIRYSHEEKTATFLETIIDPFGALTDGESLPSGIIRIPANPQKSFSAWTPKFSLEFRPTERVLTYISATRGFKSGGFNLMNTGEEFEPEKIWSYELGLKSTWFDNRLRSNWTAFYYDYKDLQVNQFSGVTNLITNAAKSHVKGVEADLAGKPSNWLSLDLGLAFLDAKYADYLTRDANTCWTCPAKPCPRRRDLPAPRARTSEFRWAPRAR